MSKIQTFEDMPKAEDVLKDVVREDGKMWLRYVGCKGPRADTVLGELWQGEPVLFSPEDRQLYPGGDEEDNLTFVMSSGEFLPMTNGRCKGIMRISKERCIQECMRGRDLCPLHCRDHAEDEIGGPR